MGIHRESPYPPKGSWDSRVEIASDRETTSEQMPEAFRRALHCFRSVMPEEVVAFKLKVWTRKKK